MRANSPSHDLTSIRQSTRRASNRASRSTLLVALACTPLFAVACAEPNEDALAPEVTAQPSAPLDSQEQTLATADVGYATIRFHQRTAADGTSEIVMSEQTSGKYSQTPLDRAVLEGHTTLELFEAILPAQEPPEAIVAAHAQEALALGRMDDSMHPATFNPTTSITKSTTACNAFVWADPADTTCNALTVSNGRHAEYIPGGQVGLHVGQYWSYATTNNVTLGICNDSNSTIFGRIGVDQGGDNNSAYSYWGWAELPPGSMWRWYNFRSVAHIIPPCSGGFCNFPYDAPSRYVVEGLAGTGATYHLKTGEIFSKNTCPIR